MTPEELERARTNREAAERQHGQRAYGTVVTHFRQSNEAINDDDVGNDLDDGAEAEAANVVPEKLKRGVQNNIMTILASDESYKEAKKLWRMA